MVSVRRAHRARNKGMACLARGHLGVVAGILQGILVFAQTREEGSSAVGDGVDLALGFVPVV